MTHRGLVLLLNGLLLVGVIAMALADMFEGIEDEGSLVAVALFVPFTLVNLAYVLRFSPIRLRALAERKKLEEQVRVLEMRERLRKEGMVAHGNTSHEPSHL